jgi:hypothetical protein
MTTPMHTDLIGSTVEIQNEVSVDYRDGNGELVAVATYQPTRPGAEPGVSTIRMTAVDPDGRFMAVIQNRETGRLFRVPLIELRVVE